MVDGDGDATEIQDVAIPVEVDDLPGFAEQRADGELADPRSEPSDRIGQHEPVRGMDEGRAPVGVGHLLRRPDVVDMPVGEQYRGRGQPVLVEDPAQGSHRPLTGIDDNRVRPRTLGQYIAVTGQHAGREPGEQHGHQCPISRLG